MTRWLNSLGEEVDIENIDREYALNILTLVLLRRGRRGYSDDDVRYDPFVQRLREVVLHGREPDKNDRKRAKMYNKNNRRLGLRFRAPDPSIDKHAEGLSEDAGLRLDVWDPGEDFIFTNQDGSDR